jgi:hypothetical protein
MQRERLATEEQAKEERGRDKLERHKTSSVYLSAAGVLALFMGTSVVDAKAYLPQPSLPAKGSVVAQKPKGLHESTDISEQRPQILLLAFNPELPNCTDCSGGEPSPPSEPSSPPPPLEEVPAPPPTSSPPSGPSDNEGESKSGELGRSDTSSSPDSAERTNWGLERREGPRRVVEPTLHNLAGQTIDGLRRARSIDQVISIANNWSQSLNRAGGAPDSVVFGDEEIAESVKDAIEYALAQLLGGAAPALTSPQGVLAVANVLLRPSATASGRDELNLLNREVQAQVRRSISRFMPRAWERNIASEIRPVISGPRVSPR